MILADFVQAQMLRELPDHAAMPEILTRMLEKSEEDRGTVQAAASDPAAELMDDGMCPLTFDSPR